MPSSSIVQTTPAQLYSNDSGLGMLDVGDAGFPLQLHLSFSFCLNTTQRSVPCTSLWVPMNSNLPPSMDLTSVT